MARLARIAGFLATLLATWAIFEVGIALMLAHPTLARFGPRGFLQKTYLWHYRNIIQNEPRMARYDPDLKYTLLPGTFSFQNTEFNNRFSVNSLGLRDDEASLSAPQVVVSGDSWPMGWGVEQDETFAKLIEKTSGMKVLNAAVSSYSTVESMRILDRIDTSRMRFFIISYKHWKAEPNLKFYEGKFKRLSRENYQGATVGYSESRRYFPGKYAWLALQELRNALPRMPHGAPPPPRDDMKEAKIFLHIVLKASHANLDKVRVIVLCEKDFVEPLRKAASSNGYPRFIRDIIPVAMPGGCDGCNYVLEDHPTARWHRLMADELLNILGPSLRRAP